MFDVSAEGYAVDVRRLAATELGTTTSLNFTLAPGGQIRGVGAAMTASAQIAGVRVDGRIDRMPADLLLRADTTDEQGRFLLDNAPLAEPIAVPRDARRVFRPSG